MRSLTLQQTGASDGSNRKPEWAARGVRWIGGALVILLHVPFAEAQVPNFSWANRAGGPKSNYGQSLTVDGAGNLYIVGSFFGSASFGSITLTGDTADYVREDALVLFLFAIG